MVTRIRHIDGHHIKRFLKEGPLQNPERVIQNRVTFAVQNDGAIRWFGRGSTSGDVLRTYGSRSNLRSMGTVMAMDRGEVVVLRNTMNFPDMAVSTSDLRRAASYVKRAKPRGVKVGISERVM